jgi:type IV pilus assembly protein PilA
MEKDKKKPKRIRGQGMTEYMIIVALIAVGAIAITKTFGQTIRHQFGKITAAMQGTTYNGADLQEVTDEKTQGKGLNDFANGASGSD